MTVHASASPAQTISLTTGLATTRHSTAPLASFWGLSLQFTQRADRPAEKDPSGKRSDTLSDPSSCAIATPPDLGGWLKEPLSNETWQGVPVPSWRTGAVVYVYAFGCPGLLSLHRVLGAPVFKIGITEDGSLTSRINDLNYRQYASHFQGEQGWTMTEGFEQWSVKSPTNPPALSPSSPVFITRDCLGVRLPEGLSVSAFDKSLNCALSPVSIDRWCRRAEMALASQPLKWEPGFGHRGTRQTKAGIDRIEESHELFFFRPRREFQSLIAIIEHILLNALRAGVTH